MKTRWSWFCAALALWACATGSSLASEGYFFVGAGATQKGLAGTGVAQAQDAMAIAINPAGLVDLERQVTGSLTAFAPTRGYDASGPGFVAPGLASGGMTSAKDLFVLPSMGYSAPLDANSAWGVAVYANAGLNTTFSAVANSSCPPGGNGVFCGGRSGVDYKQAFISLGVAHRFGAVSVGLAPILAIQSFEGTGLSAMSGVSLDPANLTDRGHDLSWGGGMRGGLEWRVTDAWRLGVAATTPMVMSDFKRYAGLFTGHGSFNVPGNIAAGMAFDVSPALTVMADIKYIWFASTGFLGNSSLIAQPLGSTNGPGFGFRDITVVSVAASWRATNDLTLRAGYAHNNQPARPANVTLNIVAPGVTTDHFSLGASYRASANSSIDLAAMYVPKRTVSGIEVTPFGPNPARTIAISMSQWEATVGWTYRFDTTDRRPPGAR